MGLGAYAFAGAMQGFGASLVKMGEDKKAEAERLRQEARDDKLRAEDRSYRETWRDEGRQYDASLRTEGREYEANQRALGAQADTNVYQSLFGTESGGNFEADNGLGYAGRAQFGQDRLDDWSRVTGAPRITPAELKKNPELQEDVEKWHFSDINQFIDDNDLSQYEGQTIGGVKITRSGIIAMAHLGGAGGAKEFLESGGKYNPEDAFGTSLSEYASRHGGLSTDMNGVWDAMSDPNVSPSVRNAAASEIANRQSPNESKKRETEKDADGFLRYVDTGERVFPDAKGKPDTKQKGLSATIKTEIRDWSDANAIDQDLKDAFVLEVQRLVNDEGMTEDEAWVTARRTANKSEDVVTTEERFILPDREKVKEGTYDGTFGKPRGLGAPEDTPDAPDVPKEPDGPSVSQEAAIAEAKAAIARGADRNAVIARLREMGIDPRGI